MNVERDPFPSKRHDPYLQSAEINLTIFRIEEPHVDSSQSAQVETSNTPDSRPLQAVFATRGYEMNLYVAIKHVRCLKTYPLPLNMHASATSAIFNMDLLHDCLWQPVPLWAHAWAEPWDCHLLRRRIILPLPGVHNQHPLV